MLSCMWKECSNWLYYSPIKNSNSANKYLLSPFLFTEHHVKSWGNNSEKKKNTGPGLMEQSQVRSFNINSDSLWLNPSYVNTLLVFNWGCGFRMREVRWSSDAESSRVNSIIQSFLLWDPLSLFDFPSASRLSKTILLSSLTRQRKGKDM